MFLVLRLPLWIEHPVTRQLLGLDADGLLTRRSPLLADARLAIGMASICAMAWWGLSANHAALGMGTQSLLPIVVLFSPLVFCTVAGFLAGWRMAGEARTNARLAGLVTTTFHPRDLLESMLMAATVRATLAVAVLTQALLLCIWAMPQPVFMAGSSIVFLWSVMLVNLLCGATLMLQSAMFHAFRLRLTGMGASSALLMHLPFHVCRGLLMMLLGLGIGGLIYFAWDSAAQWKLLQDRAADLAREPDDSPA